VIICNKQDFEKKRNIDRGGVGWEGFWKPVLRSNDAYFNHIPFIPASATGIYDEEVGYIQPWGIETAIDILFKEVTKRFEQSKQKVVIAK
jgi:hypothetical protein